MKGMDIQRLHDAATHIKHHVSLEDRMDKVEAFLFQQPAQDPSDDFGEPVQEGSKKKGKK